MDAVLEVGLGGYIIWEERVQLQVLMKLVDPYTKRVLGRTRSETYPTLGHAQALFSGDGEKFKQLVTQTGTPLITDGLKTSGFYQDRRRDLDPNSVLVNVVTQIGHKPTLDGRRA